MTSHQPLPVLGVSLSDSTALRLATDPSTANILNLQELGDLLGPGVFYLGGDRFRDTAPGQRHVDPLFAAQALLARFPGRGFLVSTSPDFEHPYNYARRILALDHFSGGRIGTVVGARDIRIDVTSRARTPWTEKPAGPELTAEFAHVLRKLWHSWPAEAIIADRERGVFADASLISTVHHEGHYAVAGPLNSPSSPQGEPPLAWHVRRPGPEADAARAHADLVIADAERLTAGGRDWVDAGADPTAPPTADGSRQGPPGLVPDVPQEGLRDWLDAVHQGGGAAGVLLRVTDLDELPGLIDEIARAHAEGLVRGLPATEQGATLRRQLELPLRHLDTSGFSAAFPG